MHAPGDRRFRTLARRVTLGGLGTFWLSVWIGMIWKAATGAWPGESLPQGPFLFFAVLGLLALCGGTAMQAVDGAVDGAVRVVRWCREKRERRNRPNRTEG